MAVYDILMIDDDVDNYHSLKNFASDFNVVLKYSRTLEEGLRELENNQRILGIILDGKGLLYQFQYSSQVTTAFVHEALTEIRLLEQKRKKEYPKCVLTAWYDHLKESLEGRVKVFDKKKIANDNLQKQELFEYLTVQAQDSTEYSIRKKHQSVFRLFDEKYILPEADDIFYSCCAAIEKRKVAPSDFAAIRQLYEMVLIAINQKDKSLLPDALFKQGGSPNLDWTLRFLNGQEVKANGKEIAERSEPRVPAHIHDCAYFVKEISSAFTHQYAHHFTINGFMAGFYAWIEFFTWYTIWVDNKKSNNN